VEAKQELLVQAQKRRRRRSLLWYSPKSSPRQAKRKAAGLREDVIKATQRTGLQSLTSPVDGVVQQLGVHTVGGVVTPAQSLLAVVPANTGHSI